jgi:hypothetical protein
MSRLVRKSNNEWDFIREAGGGLNELAEPYEIPDKECSELTNFFFAPGAWVKRSGSTKKLKVFSETKITSLFLTHFAGATNYLIVAAGTNLYKIDYDEDTWAAEALTVDLTLTTGQRFDFAQMSERVYMTNGSNRPMKWLGSTYDVEQIGITAPSNGTAAYSAIGTGTTGDHGVRITWYNSNAGTESDYYDMGTVTNAGSKKLSITGLTDSTDPQVTHLRIYITKAGETATYYLAAAVAIGGTYEAAIGDESLSTTMQAVVDEADAALPPEKAKFIAAAKQRLFLGYIYRSGAWRKDEIAWSEQVGLNITEPEYFPSTNWRRVNTRGGEITRLVLWGDYLYIFHTKGISVMTDPSDPDNSIITELVQATGCTAPWSVQVGMFKKPVPAPPELQTEEFELVPGIIYLGQWGVMGFDGTREYPLSEKVQKTVNSIAPSAMSDVVGFFHNGKYYLAYGERYGAAGESQTVKEITSDSGGESITATFSSSLEYTSGTDAINYLANTSKPDSEIKVGLYFPLNQIWNLYKKAVYVSFGFAIYFSKDSGATWELKLKSAQANSGRENGTAQENYEYKFIDSNVNAVRVDYFFRHPVGTYQISTMNFNYVQYSYDPSATIINNKMLYYDSMENKWAKIKDWNGSAFAALDNIGDDGAEIMGHSSNGTLYRINEGTTDDGEPVFARLVTGYTDGKFPEAKKVWLRDTMVMEIGNEDVHFLAYVDRLEKNNRILNRRAEGEREQYYDEQYYGDGFYNLSEGEKHFAMNMDPNAGYRLAEEIWVSSRESLVVRGRIASFVKREI